MIKNKYSKTKKEFLCDKSHKNSFSVIFTFETLWNFTRVENYPMDNPLQDNSPVHTKWWAVIEPPSLIQSPSITISCAVIG